MAERLWASRGLDADELLVSRSPIIADSVPCVLMTPEEFDMLAAQLAESRPERNTARQLVCAGCDTEQRNAVARVIEGRVACCPDCSTLTVGARNAIRKLIAERDDAVAALEAARARAQTMRRYRFDESHGTPVADATGDYVFFDDVVVAVGVL